MSQSHSMCAKASPCWLQNITLQNFIPLKVSHAFRLGWNGPIPDCLWLMRTELQEPHPQGVTAISISGSLPTVIYTVRWFKPEQPFPQTPLCAWLCVGVSQKEKAWLFRLTAWTQLWFSNSPFRTFRTHHGSASLIKPRLHNAIWHFWEETGWGEFQRWPRAICFPVPWR